MATASRETTVFIVDDDEAVRDSLQILLELHGHATEIYESTDDFVRHYRRPRRGCLILDQHLPMTTGLDFMASAAGQTLGIPVLLLTGHGDAQLKNRALDVGVAAYLDKPASEQALLTAIDRLLANGA